MLLKVGSQWKKPNYDNYWNVAVGSLKVTVDPNLSIVSHYCKIQPLIRIAISVITTVMFPVIMSLKTTPVQMAKNMINFIPTTAAYTQRNSPRDRE